MLQQDYSLADVDHNRNSPLNPDQKVHANFSSDTSPANSYSHPEKEWKASGVETPAGVHELLVDELFPADSFYKGTYWADLPRAAKNRWIWKQSNAEAKRELKVVGRMTKADPLSPVRAYFGRYVLGGMGLFLEGFTLFSIGNLSPLYKAVWPECWKTHEVCEENWLRAVDYLEICGIIVGQVLVGFEGDWVGRKFGLVQDALIMFLGLLMLTASWGTTLNGWVICYAWCLFIYGVGVGGEYPMTSTNALESRQGVSPEAMSDDRLHRGRNVALAFLMQGWGQLANQVILIVLLLIFHGSGNPPYSVVSTQWTFRVQFAIVTVGTLWLAYQRYYHGDYRADKKLRAKKRQGSVTGYDTKSLKLAISHFGPRMIGTAGTWFANDFFFYGNKLFQGAFIAVIIPTGSTVMDGWLYNLINIGVSLAGYYMAAFLMDHKSYGRVRMQAVGFLLDFILILLAASMYDRLTEPAHIHAFQAIYYLSSFFNQFGPNSTTFLLAAEVYPTSIRATAHGVSAACGKLGALAPAILYNYIDTSTKFWVVTWFGLLGFILTILFIPDTTGLDLREQERYWSFVRAGRAGDYHGTAVNPRHLSLWERVVNKRHHAYDPVKDREMKMEELSEAYARALEAKLNELPGDLDLEEDEGLSDSVHLYFQEVEKKKRNEILAKHHIADSTNPHQYESDQARRDRQDEIDTVPPPNSSVPL